LKKRLMKVETDKRSGFCFGVMNAVEIAEKELLNGEKIYSLGSIVHNDKELERLTKLGLVTIGHKEFRKLKNVSVLIRAHGEPPETYLTAEKNNIRIIEATCPIVKKLQSKIRNAWLKAREYNGQVVIFGKTGHAEVIGLMGQIQNEGILVLDTGDISKIDVTRPVWLFSQTTMNTEKYDMFIKSLGMEMKKKGICDPDSCLHVHNTICRQVSDREPSLRKFAARHDIIIFVSGKDSSNGRMLFSIAREINPSTYFISSAEEIDKAWFRGKKSAGISGATSTPGWLIEKVYNVVSNI